MKHLAGYIILIVLLGLQVGKAVRAEKALNLSRQDSAVLLGQLERDDDLLSTVFKEWDRTRPVLSTRVSVTCYTSRPQETDDSPHITADGSIVRRGIIAVSRDLLHELGLSYGQRVLLDGYGVMEVRDTMNKRWERRVDVWSSDLTAAKMHGKKDNVTLLWLGK